MKKKKIMNTRWLVYFSWSGCRAWEGGRVIFLVRTKRAGLSRNKNASVFCMAQRIVIIIVCPSALIVLLLLNLNSVLTRKLFF